MIIEPTGPVLYPADRDYTLVLDDWATGSGRAVADIDRGNAGPRGSIGGMMGRAR
jgi:hypothetical protein